MQVTFTANTAPLLIQQMVDFLKDFRPAPNAEETHATAATTVQDPASAPSNAPASATLDDVRARFSRLISAGRAENAKAILAELGATKLSDLAPVKYLNAIQSADALLR